MIEMIKSKALEVNLSRTQNVPYTIPEKHLQILKLSENYWGIHKRVEDFLKEFQHPFSNRKEVVQLMNNVFISDFWIYKNLEQREDVIDQFLEIFEQLFKEKLPEIIYKQLLFTYLNFIDSQYDTISEFNKFHEKVLFLLNSNFENHEFSYFINIGYFRKKLKQWALNPNTKDLCTDFMIQLIKNHIQFWKETTQIEKWYSENQSKMSQDYSKSIFELGSYVYDYYDQKILKAENWDQLCDNTFTVTDIIDALKSKISTFSKASEQFLYIFSA